jgi:hypothetical protein
MTQQFREAWHALTEDIFSSCNSLGSRLHESDDGTWVAYAQWRDREAWEKCPQLMSNQTGHARLAECLDGETQVLFRLTVLDDLLR